MTHPTHVQFHGLAPSEAATAAIRERSEKLARFGDIREVRAVVDLPHQHQHQGKIFSVRLHVARPRGADIEVTHQPATAPHEDVYVAIRDAFDAAERQLRK